MYRMRRIKLTLQQKANHRRRQVEMEKLRASKENFPQNHHQVPSSMWTLQT